jgi:hypothetical protein
MRRRDFPNADATRHRGTLVVHGVPEPLVFFLSLDAIGLEPVLGLGLEPVLGLGLGLGLGLVLGLDAASHHGNGESGNGHKDKHKGRRWKRPRRSGA